MGVIWPFSNLSQDGTSFAPSYLCTFVVGSTTHRQPGTWRTKDFTKDLWNNSRELSQQSSVLQGATSSPPTFTTVGENFGQNLQSSVWQNQGSTIAEESSGLCDVNSVSSMNEDKQIHSCLHSWCTQELWLEKLKCWYILLLDFTLVRMYSLISHLCCPEWMLVLLFDQDLTSLFFGPPCTWVLLSVTEWIYQLDTNWWCQ